MDAEFERDPAFRDYINRKGIEALAMRTLEARRPTGSYREDGSARGQKGFSMQKE